MGSFYLGKMTFGSLFKKPETTCYPLEEKTAPEGLKGYIENRIKTCIFCGMCEKNCPSDALSVDKPTSTWEINVFQCVQCGACVRVCPTKSLSMEAGRPGVATEMAIRSLTREESPEEAAEKARKEAAKAEKVKAALAAKAAREKQTGEGEISSP